MDRHLQQIKRTRQDVLRHATNLRNKSKMRKLIKKFMASNSPDEASGLYQETISFLDKMSQKGILHKNTAARKKSQITRHLNSITKS
ncbi:30S ribosomal protein S20 [Candidatus Neomarinimicrobiota bacterium]